MTACTRPMSLVFGLAAGLLLTGCPQKIVDTRGETTLVAAPTLAQQTARLGAGLGFYNGADSIPADATHPDAGARFVYDRRGSANARKSPMDVEIWVFGANGERLHERHADYLRSVYRDVYGWDHARWKTELGGAADADAVLQAKSDLFWESLAQHLAERVFAAAITPAIYRHGPRCRTAGATGACADPGLVDALRVVVKTTIDGRRDPMNPVTRRIYYDVARGELRRPDLILEIDVHPLRVAGPNQERVDYRPLVKGANGIPKKIESLRVWAHVPKGQRERTTNFDYPDYNLLFVPLRHLVLRGEVTDALDPSAGMIYPSKERLIEEVAALLTTLRTPSGGRAVAKRLEPFLTSKYYYMFAEGQGIEGYRSYILGDAAGVGRGLNPDFGRIELLCDGVLAATLLQP